MFIKRDVALNNWVAHKVDAGSTETIIAPME